MKFTSENATFFQSGFNFFIGDIVDESTIIFNEDFIVIGNLKSEKNVFAMGELIVIGDIECKSIYVTKDFLSVGEIVSEVVEVEGCTKTLDKSILTNIPVSKIVNYENDESKFDEVIKVPNNLDYEKMLLKEEVERKDLNEIYKRYLSKKGDLVEGKICNINEEKAIVDLGDIEASIDIDTREISIGMKICSYIKSVILYNTELSIILENKDRSYITKVINRELSKNKYDLSKVYFKNIEIGKDGNILVTMLSEQFKDSSLKIIEQKIAKYFYKKNIKLNLYGSENKCKENKYIKVLESPIKNIKGFNCGDEVLHNKFGEGKITNIIDLDTAQIDFNGIIKTINISILVKSGLIRKKESINENIRNTDNKVINSNEYIEINKSRLSISQSKKYTLVTGIVTKVDSKRITLKIDKNTIGVLEREDDIKDNILYNVGDEVIAYVLNIYMRNEKIELQLIKNNSNYFKLMFQKYKDYLDLKNCNLKLCKYVSSMGALLIVDKKYKFTELNILAYIIQLMNESAGFNIVRVIDYAYDPYVFLSNVFDVSEKDIYKKNGIYYVNNPEIKSSSEVQTLCEELEKLTKYKIKLN
ncbi:hypothetical protein [Paraclostridium sordellii]|uniref:hypothetical protein n=1 Tax=Paraclostridium sordellii TaxID=1505 RepID=UPI001C615B8B|nr:hypothetical protein [Paeniclostridium sordellii]QYE99112.1 hypothetical protein KZ987_06270 [Paeniclostridium sordellii]